MESCDATFRAVINRPISVDYGVSLLIIFAIINPMETIFAERLYVDCQCVSQLFTSYYNEGGLTI